MSCRKLLLVSNSLCHGRGYFDHVKSEMIEFFQKNNVTDILFIPYAVADQGEYSNRIAAVFEKWGYNVVGIDRFADPLKAVNQSKCIFIGGGNTFVLTKQLWENNLVHAIRKRVLEDGVPYIGSSAGTNVATRSIQVTNDMPIVYPPTFEALCLVPFNINSHYVDDQDSDYNGESREERILQFLEHNDYPVLGLREGTALLVDGNTAALIGSVNARLFWKNQKPIEYVPGSDLSFMMEWEAN